MEFLYRGTDISFMHKLTLLFWATIILDRCKKVVLKLSIRVWIFWRCHQLFH